MNKPMKPPFSYYGGKQRIASKIIPHIPKHTVYVEPFCGGATLLFKKPWPEVTNTHHYREVINDKNEILINFFRVLQDKNLAAQLQHRLDFTLYSRSEHEKAKGVLQDPKDTNEIDLAWSWFVKIQTSFSNVLSGGWRTSVVNCNEQARWASKKDLRGYVSRMQSVAIESLDALETIKKWDSPQSFFYCDPPYPEANQGHYSGYTVQDFENLVAALDQAQGGFMLSCYDVPGVSIPEDWERIEIAAHCSASGKGQVGKNRDKTKAANGAELGNRKRTEIVYKRLPKEEPRSEIIKLYTSGKFNCYEGGDMNAAYWYRKKKKSVSKAKFLTAGSEAIPRAWDYLKRYGGVAWLVQDVRRVTRDVEDTNCKEGIAILNRAPSCDYIAYGSFICEPVARIEDADLEALAMAERIEK